MYVVIECMKFQELRVSQDKLLVPGDSRKDRLQEILSYHENETVIKTSNVIISYEIVNKSLPTI